MSLRSLLVCLSRSGGMSGLAKNVMDSGSSISVATSRCTSLALAHFVSCQDNPSFQEKSRNQQFLNVGNELNLYLNCMDWKKSQTNRKKKTPTNLHYLARFRLRLNLLVLFNELMMPRIGWGSWVWDMERAHLFRWAWVWTQDELPRYTCSKESICHCGRCRRHRFSPWVRKIPVDKEMATHSSILAWKDPMWKRAWQSTVHGVAKSQTQQCVLTHTQPLGETFKPIWASASPSEAYDFLLI